MTYQVPAPVVPGTRRAGERSALVHPRVDAWATGWLAVLIWAFIAVAQALDVLAESPRWIFWIAAFISATHFAMSYRLAYDTPRVALRTHPIALLWAPATLAATLAALLISASLGSEAAGDGIRSMVTLVFALTMWHYVKQAFGVTMIAARHAGFAFDRRERLTLRYGLYPLWAISTLGYLSGRQVVSIADVDVRTDLLSGLAGTLRQLLVVTSMVVLVGTLAIAARRARRLPPASVVAPLLAAVLWVGALPSAALAVMLLPALHALQYLACAGRAQHRLLDDEGRAPRVQTWHVVQIMVAAGCVGLLVTSSLPIALERAASPWEGTTLWPVTIFVALNLHHYLIDATVWRSDGRLVQAVMTERSPVASALNHTRGR